MAKSKKFKPMNRRPGGKNTDHGPGYIEKIVSAVAAGTPNARQNAPVAYHGIPPHVEDIAPGPRPSVAPVEPQDVPGADDQTRHIDPTPYPTTHGHHSPGKSGTVPPSCGGNK